MKRDDAHDAPLSGLSTRGDFADATRGVETPHVAAAAPDVSPARSPATDTSATHAGLTPDVVRDIPPGGPGKVSAHGACHADADRFAVDLRREDEGWKASCLSLHQLEATGRTPGQALSRMTRVINRHLHRDHRAVRVQGRLGSAELNDHPLAAASSTADEG